MSDSFSVAKKISIGRQADLARIKGFVSEEAADVLQVIPAPIVSDSLGLSKLVRVRFDEAIRTAERFDGRALKYYANGSYGGGASGAKRPVLGRGSGSSDSCDSHGS